MIRAVCRASGVLMVTGRVSEFVLEIERGGSFWYVGGIVMNREPDIFYDTSGLTHEQQEALLRKAYSIMSLSDITMWIYSG